MKHNALRSIAHNIADSLASGIGLMIGVYEMDVFGEAGRSPDGVLTVDFLNGLVVEGTVSPLLRDAVRRYSEALPDLCKSHGASLEDFRGLTVRYASDYTQRRFWVTIEDSRSRRSTTEYAGVPGRRPKIRDHLGRLRRKRSMG